MFQPNKHKPNLPEIERNNMAFWLLQNSSESKLRYGAKKKVAHLFNLDLKSVWKIWKQVQLQQALSKPVHVVSMKKGSVHKDRKVLDEEKFKSLSVLQRGSIKMCSMHMGVNIGTIFKWKKDKSIKPCSNAIKPFLTPANMIASLKWSLSMLSSISSNGRIVFRAMFNIIHIDEKWFNLSKTTQRYYILKGEEQPYRTCKSKSHIDKIMFMCVVGRPHTDSEGKVIFDGKFGIFPFTFKEPAARNSKNRPKGSIITKPIIVITRPIMKECFLKEIVPTIKEKWPEGISKWIIIQQDNARPHINNNDPEFQAIANSDGFHIQLVCQPPNSPDTNVNDLGFFRAIQSLNDEKLSTTIEDLIKNVNDAFDEFPSYKINSVFLTLQGCYKEIIKVKGSNNYEIPHMGKGHLIRDGMLPETLDVDEQDVKDAYEYLQEEDNAMQPVYNLEAIIDGMQQVNLHE